MQVSFPPALRVAQSVATLASAGDTSLVALNTNELSPDCLVMVQSLHTLYILHKGDNTTASDSPNVIVPAVGPGRWFQYGAGSSHFQDLSITHALIPPQSSVDSPVTVSGVEDSGDIIVFNLTDTGLPAGVTIGPVRVTGANAATFRFLNATAASVAAGAIAVRAAVLHAP